MIKYLDSILLSFRGSFTRKSSFNWFVIIIIGFMLNTDSSGVTSIIRELALNPKNYENLLHFFRSNAWTIEILSNCWTHVTKANAPILKVNDATILIADGVKQSKEGKKMAGVKKLHQESENSSKAKYIMGHMFGVVSVLIGNVKKQFALPLSATIQDGVEIIRKFENPSYEPLSHVVQVIVQAGNITKILGKSVLLLDRYFLSAPALKKSMEFLDEDKEKLLEIVTKAKISCKAYNEPPAYSGKGRPRLKGSSVKLRDLFETCRNNFITTDLYLYGSFQTVQYYSVDLLWGVKLYRKLRFVLVKSEKYPPSILVSTSLTFSPTQIIEMYSYRYKIEISFKTLKHTLFGFCYHFWSLHMPVLNRYNKKQNIENLEQVHSISARNKIVSSLKAIEGFVLCSCISCGILQMISLKFSNTSISSLFCWYRTKTNTIVTESTIAYYFRKNFFRLVKKHANLSIMKIIISKQENDDDFSSKSA